jgi:WD40 repeat protein
LRRRAVYLAGALVVAAILAVLAIGAGRQASANAAEAQTNANQAATSAAQAVTNAELAADRQEEAESERQAAVAAKATAEAEALVRATAQAEAERERETAEQQARLATSRELSLAALNTLPRDPELSILLALQAVEKAYTQAAEDALHRAVQQSRLRWALPDVTIAVFHPDGGHVATVNRTALHVWDLAAEQATLTITLPVEAWAIAYSPDGRTLATGHVDGRVILWDATDGIENQVLKGHNREVYEVPFSPDGRYLASTGFEGVAILWDLESGQARFSFPSAYRWGTNLAFSPDGALLAIAELEEDVLVENAVLNLWDTESGALRFTIQEPSLMIAFSPDGAYAVTAGPDNSPILWDMVTSLELGTAQPVATLRGHTAAVPGGVFSPDGALVATTSQDGTAKVWDPATGEEHFTLAGHKQVVLYPAFSPDGRYLLTSGGDGARIWDVSLPGNEEVMALPGPEVSGDVSLALSPDGSYLALGGVGGKIHLHDAGDGQLLAVLVGHTGGVRNIAFSSDGSRLATAGRDSLVKVWDVVASLSSGDGQELLTLKGHEEAVSGGAHTGVGSVAFSPYGARLATAGADGTVRLWDAATGGLLLTVDLHPNGALGVAFSPDGQYLAAASELPDAIVKVWRFAGNELVELYTLSAFPSRVVSVKFSPDGAHLVTSGHSAHLAIWDALTGEPLGDFSGHVGTVGRIAFSPDGRTLVSSSLDATIRLWDVASRTNRLTLSTELPPNDVSFSPDGAYLYASDRSGGVNVYALELETLQRLAHERLTRWWTPEECRQYLHQETCPEP